MRGRNTFAFMKFMVTGDKTIAAVQQEFHEAFPFLKAEFFLAKTGSGKTHVPPNRKLEAFKTNSHSEIIHITSAMTVAELEEKFISHYGLVMQIYRKSGKAWLETTLTDNWTLQEQNEQGKALSS